MGLVCSVDSGPCLGLAAVEVQKDEGAGSKSTWRHPCSRVGGLERLLGVILESIVMEDTEPLLTDILSPPTRLPAWHRLFLPLAPLFCWTLAAACPKPRPLNSTLHRIRHTIFVYCTTMSAAFLILWRNFTVGAVLGSRVLVLFSRQSPGKNPTAFHFYVGIFIFP